jgi:hypothetical protein
MRVRILRAAEDEMQAAAVFYEAQRVARFPYRVYFRSRESGLVIVAVAHYRRRPGFWRSRLLPG